MNPNHYLAVAIDYLYRTRTGWRQDAAVGKTLVSSSIIDRVAESLGRRLWEVPVGFKWFVPGLIDGSVGFGGEESAGASFLRLDGSVWTTDKDGILLALLASEILAVTGKTPSQLYDELTEKFGDPVYERVDAPASPAREVRARQARRRRHRGHRAGGRTHHGKARAAPPATTQHSAASRSRRPPPGSPPDRAARRTSTRSTRNPSSAPRISARYKRRRSASSATRWRAPSPGRRRTVRRRGCRSTPRGS